MKVQREDGEDVITSSWIDAPPRNVTWAPLLLPEQLQTSSQVHPHEQHNRYDSVLLFGQSKKAQKRGRDYVFTDNHLYLYSCRRLVGFHPDQFSQPLRPMDVC
jgi:hypothetical protein